MKLIFLFSFLFSRVDEPRFRCCTAAFADDCGAFVFLTFYMMRAWNVLLRLGVRRTKIPEYL